jgi:hypothetical protein
MVYVIKNGATLLFSGPILGYGATNTTQQVSIASGDYLDFVVGQQILGYGETRVSLDATLVKVPTPVVMASTFRSSTNERQKLIPLAREYR